MTQPIQTERLTLRRFTASDAGLLFALDSDPQVTRYLSGGQPTPQAVIDAEILPRFIGLHHRFPDLGYWAATEVESGAFIGWFALRPPDRSPSPAVEAELGYRLRSASWSQGYATEGARFLIRWGFQQGGLLRVTATVYEENQASRRVLEKAGLRLVRAFRLTEEELRATATFDASTSTLWDGHDLEYALEREDWERTAAQQPSP